ncbi:MAG: DnaB-like helicase N-terminal domain-containing protein, partial [Candidatus Omnitrophota bacterium]
LKKQGIGLNQITVAQHLASDNKLEVVGGSAYLAHCIIATPTSLDVEYYAEIVGRLSVCRKLSSTLGNLQQKALSAPQNLNQLFDDCDHSLGGLRTKMIAVPRKMEITRPRLIQTKPVRYIWNVNGMDVYLKVEDIIDQGRFKKLIISELNFVPIIPKNWEDVVNNLLNSSIKIEAPRDASDDFQLKLLIQKWIEQTMVASSNIDLKSGAHLIKEFGTITYVCFQSTPLMDRLKKQYNRVMKAGDIWGSHVSRWGGIQKSIRMRTPDGGSTVVTDMWCIPITFLEENLSKQQPMKLIETQNNTDMPEDF